MQRLLFITRDNQEQCVRVCVGGGRGKKRGGGCLNEQYFVSASIGYYKTLKELKSFTNLRSILFRGRNRARIVFAEITKAGVLALLLKARNTTLLQWLVRFDSSTSMSQCFLMGARLGKHLRQ